MQGYVLPITPLTAYLCLNLVRNCLPKVNWFPILLLYSESEAKVMLKYLMPVTQMQKSLQAQKLDHSEDCPILVTGDPRDKAINCVA